MDTEGVKRALRISIARAAIARDAPELNPDVDDDQALELRYGKDALELFDAAWTEQFGAGEGDEEPR